MSKKYPECPVYDHNICKEFKSPALCAVVRGDKKCLKPSRKKTINRDNKL